MFGGDGAAGAGDGGKKGPMKCPLCERWSPNYDNWLVHLTSDLHQTRVSYTPWEWKREGDRCLEVVEAQGVNLSTFVAYLSKWGVLLDFFRRREEDEGKEVFWIKYETTEAIDKILAAQKKSPHQVQGKQIFFKRKNEEIGKKTSIGLLLDEYWDASADEGGLGALQAYDETDNAEGMVDLDQGVELEIVEDGSKAQETAAPTENGNSTSVTTGQAEEGLFGTKLLKELEAKLKDKPLEDQLEKFCERLGLTEKHLQERYAIVQELLNRLKLRYPKATIYPYGMDFIGIGNTEDPLSVYVDLFDNVLAETKQPWETNPESHLPQVFQILKLEEDNNRFCCGVSKSEDTIWFRHRDSKITVSIRLSGYAAVQESMLIKFLCTLDPRVRHLLMLVRYWACAYKVLDITKGCDEVPGKFIVMLMIFHLSNRNVLPTVSKLQMEPHNSQVILNGVDLSFSTDKEKLPQPNAMILKDKSIAALSSLGLLSDFFQRFGKADLKENAASLWLGKFVVKQNLKLKKSLPEALNKKMTIGPKGERLSKCFSVGDVDHPFCVQDIFNVFHNLGETLSKEEVKRFQVFGWKTGEKVEAVATCDNPNAMEIFTACLVFDKEIEEMEIQKQKEFQQMHKQVQEEQQKLLQIKRQKEEELRQKKLRQEEEDRRRKFREEEENKWRARQEEEENKRRARQEEERKLQEQERRRQEQERLRQEEERRRQEDLEREERRRAALAEQFLSQRQRREDDHQISRNRYGSGLLSPPPQYPAASQNERYYREPERIERDRPSQLGTTSSRYVSRQNLDRQLPPREPEQMYHMVDQRSSNSRVERDRYNVSEDFNEQQRSLGHHLRPEVEERYSSVIPQPRLPLGRSPFPGGNDAAERQAVPRNPAQENDIRRQSDQDDWLMTEWEEFSKTLEEPPTRQPMSFLTSHRKPVAPVAPSPSKQISTAYHPPPPPPPVQPYPEYNNYGGMTAVREPVRYPASDNRRSSSEMDEESSASSSSESESEEEDELEALPPSAVLEQSKISNPVRTPAINLNNYIKTMFLSAVESRDFAYGIRGKLQTLFLQFMKEFNNRFWSKCFGFETELDPIYQDTTPADYAKFGERKSIKMTDLLNSVPCHEDNFVTTFFCQSIGEVSPLILNAHRSLRNVRKISSQLLKILMDERSPELVSSNYNVRFKAEVSIVLDYSNLNKDCHPFVRLTFEKGLSHATEMMTLFRFIGKVYNKMGFKFLQYCFKRWLESCVDFDMKTVVKSMENIERPGNRLTRKERKRIKRIKKAEAKKQKKFLQSQEMSWSASSLPQLPQRQPTQQRGFVAGVGRPPTQQVVGYGSYPVHPQSEQGFTMNNSNQVVRNPFNKGRIVAGKGKFQVPPNWIRQDIPEPSPYGPSSMNRRQF